MQARPARARRPPPSPNPTPAPPLVGREGHLGLLLKTLAAGPAIVAVEGEAGVGKTRLIREALDRLSRPESAQTGGVAGSILIAAFPAVPAPSPLGAVVSGIKRLNPDLGQLQLSGLAGALRPLFPEWGDDLPPTPDPLDDAGATRHRVFRALTELIDALDVGLLVLEDAHWADSATLEWLLTLLADDPAPQRSLLLAYRPWDITAASLLPRLTARTPIGMSSLHLALEPLDVAETRQLVAASYDTAEVSDSFALFLHRATGGLPLALQEYLLLLEDREDIRLADGQWSRRSLDELSVPAGIRESVLERVQRLDAPTRRLLEAASIDPEPLTEALLAAIAELEPEVGRGAVARALECGLLQEPTPLQFTFRHALDAQAVNESIPVSLRRRLHARAAHVLQQQEHPPAARLARHFREAGDADRWSQYAERSAQLALDSGDDRTAVETLLQVIDVEPHPARRVALARLLGRAAFFSADALGDLNTSVAGALRSVLTATDLTCLDRGELQLHLGRMLWQSGHWSAAFEQWQAAAEALETDRPDLAIRAMSNLGVPLTSSWPAALHRHWLDRAHGLIDQVSTKDQAAFTHMRISALLLMGDAVGWRELQRLPRSGSTAEEDRDLTGTLGNAALAILAWGRYQDVEGLLSLADRLTEQSENPRMRHVIAVARARLDWYRGDWSGLADRARAVAGSAGADSSTRLHARQVGALVSAAGGSRTATAELRRLLDDQQERAVLSPGAPVIPAALARAYLSDGHPARALAATSSLVDVIVQKELWFWLSDIAETHVEALLANGRSQQACEFVARLRSELRDHRLPAPDAALRACEGLLAADAKEPQDAAQAFEDAARMWAALPRPYDELLCRERQAEQLIRVGDSVAGVEILTDVQLRLRELGARRDADRVARLVREQGQDVATTWRGGRRGYGDTLSPREVEVVDLVTQGYSNQQMATTLYLSRRTVEGHLRSAMRKLEVHSRTALAVTALEAGIVRTAASDAARAQD